MTVPGPGSSMSSPAELVDELRRRVQAALDAGRAARFANGETDGDDDLTASLANMAETLGPDDPVVAAVARALLVPAARISAHEAAVVCHHFGISGGYPGSGFTAQLVALMARADWENLRRLGQGFPGYAAAVALAQHDQQEGAALSAIARRAPEPVGFRCPRCGSVSYHPMDLTEGYCGQCKTWTAPTGAGPPG